MSGESAKHEFEETAILVGRAVSSVWPLDTFFRTAE